MGNYKLETMVEDNVTISWDCLLMVEYDNIIVKVEDERSYPFKRLKHLESDKN